MKTIIDYKVASGLNIADLNKSAKELIDNGFVPSKRKLFKYHHISGNVYICKEFIKYLL